MPIKFLDFFTPDNINEMCKEGTVKVEITVYDRIKEQIIDFGEHGERVIRHEDKILSQHGKEIRSWKDLFTIIENGNARKGSQKSLDPQLRKNMV